MTENNSILILIQKYEEAIKLNKSLYLDADEFDELADYYEYCDDWDKYKDVVNLALAIHPQNSNLLFKKAKYLVNEEQYFQALELLNSEKSYDFDIYLIKIECYLCLNLMAEATHFTQEMIRQEKEDQADMYEQLGFIYLESDLMDEGISYLEESLKHKPDNNTVLTDLADAYEEIGDYKSAVDTLNRILDDSPYDSEAWVNLGKLYTMLGQYVEAVEAFDFAIAIEGENVNLLRAKAHCLSLTDRIEEAITTTKQVLEELPDDESCLFLLSECYQKAGMISEAYVALEDYGKVTEYPIHYVAKKVELMISEGRNEEAHAFIEKRLEDEPEYAIELHVIASEVKLRQELYEEAEEMLMRIYAGNENNFLVLNMLSIIAIKREEYAKAITLCEQLLEIDFDEEDEDTEEELRQRLALLYFEVNNEALFNELLDQFSDRELMSLFKYIYNPGFSGEFDRNQLMFYLNDARERRVLFKNLEY